MFPYFTNKKYLLKLQVFLVIFVTNSNFKVFFFTIYQIPFFKVFPGLRVFPLLSKNINYIKKHIQVCISVNKFCYFQKKLNIVIEKNGQALVMYKQLRYFV